MNKIIFLDIDGVLNCNGSDTINGVLLGVDDDKLVRLKEIISSTGAKIVLCSSWKSYWQKYDKSEQGELGEYLDDRFAEHEICITDKTIDKGHNRGEGIANYILEHDIKSWIVIDDEVFSDYETYGILPHLIKTAFWDGGLQDNHVNQAIEKLGSEAIRIISVDLCIHKTNTNKEIKDDGKEK